jgi:hypothetical protein
MQFNIAFALKIRGLNDLAPGSPILFFQFIEHHAIHFSLFVGNGKRCTQYEWSVRYSLRITPEEK